MLHLGSCFAARGHAVDLVLAIPGGPLEGQIPSELRVVNLGAKRTVRALPAFARYLRRERPEALLSTLEHSNILAVWASWLARAGTRVVLREASDLVPTEQVKGVSPRVLRALMRGCYRSANKIIAVSKSVEASLIANLGIPPRQIQTIYNPIVTADLQTKAAAPLDDDWFRAGAPPVVLGVGRLVPAKDFGTLLRAFVEVRAKRPARLVILGEGADRAALEKLTAQLGIQADVRMPGFDPNPLRYMSRSAVFALSSVHEGLPGALIQAMACGCRVVSTDCPGAREILESGRRGPLVPIGDPPALARGILALLDEADRSPARVPHPVERFGEKRAIDEYLEILCGRSAE